MTKERLKEYKKAWREAHKEQIKATCKAYYQENKEKLLSACKEYYQANKQERKDYYETHKEQRIASAKAWQAANKDKYIASKKEWQAANKEQCKAYAKNYVKNDVNSFGETKHSIRQKSRYILNKSGIKIPGYQIHHCFTYDDPTKFIYCSKSLHLKIHQYLHDNNIDADSNHYEQIKHLLDESVVVFGV